MFFDRNKVLGLDIGSNNIKVVELNHKRDKIELVSYGIKETPPEAIQNGQITNPSAVAEVVGTIIESRKMKRRKVAIGLWGSGLIIKKISIPRVDKKMIDEQVRWESEQYIPFDPNEVVSSYSVISSESSSETIDILLVAAQKTLIKSFVDVVIGAKLEIGIIDVNSFALANIFELSYGVLPEENPIGIINIGAVNTHVVVLIKGKVVFARDIPTGGNHFNYEISKELDITYKEAESFKLSTSVGSEVPQEVPQIIKNTCESVASDIHNAFEFFSVSNSDLRPTVVYYTGGASQTIGLIPALINKMNCTFIELNTFKKIRPTGPIHFESLIPLSPLLPMVCGLGVRQVGDS